ncbi:MAG: RDD family protein [Bacteroidota bacterium]
MENNEPHILEEQVINLVPANHLKRFANYLIDVIIFSILLTFLVAFADPVYPLMHKIMAKQPISLVDQLMISFVYGLYMSCMEAVLKGKSIGKYITGTRAVAENGRPVDARTAFMRGLIRIIPFEQFSAISMPARLWHDRWSSSFVVDEAKSILPKD